MSEGRLCVIWSSADPGVAMNMVFMYTMNSKRFGWWDEVRLLIWGPSGKLLTENAELQAELVKVEEAGVELAACKACADRYGVSDRLSDLGVNVMYTGELLTDMLKSGWHTLTF